MLNRKAGDFSTLVSTLGEVPMRGQGIRDIDRYVEQVKAVMLKASYHLDSHISRIVIMVFPYDDTA